MFIKCCLKNCWVVQSIKLICKMVLMGKNANNNVRNLIKKKKKKRNNGQLVLCVSHEFLSVKLLKIVDTTVCVSVVNV